MKGLSLADHIFAERASGVRLDWIADVLAFLVWLTRDNGAAICQSLRAWLAGDNEEKAAVALVFDEVFLWNTEAEMNELLSNVESRFPRLVPLCGMVRSRWEAQIDPS